MRHHTIHVDDIQIGERHRALSDDAVDRLASSMKDIGLMQPISVRLVEEMEVAGKMLAGAPVLVAGHHRLAAAKRLGWSHIDCVEVDDNSIEAELWEIAENLHRLDLTKEQRDEHIRRYAELLERRFAENPKPQVAAMEIGYGKPPPRPKSIARQIADETGLSDDTVRRALNPKPVFVKAVVEPESEHDAIIREANAIVSAWNRARQEARDLALEQIDEPVFDRTRSAA
jgi:ParB/RepB/Spo0J family partition protein